MRLLKKISVLIVMFAYAFGASTFSHMAVMAHPTSHSMEGHHMADSETTTDSNKCIQLCKYIEQSKLSFLIATPPSETITFSPYLFPIVSYEDIWNIIVLEQYRSNKPPGNLSFIHPHLAIIESTVLVI